MQGTSKVLLVIYVVLAARKVCAVETQHVVIWNPTSFLDSWASGQTFKVGDQLVFKYYTAPHNVLELPNEKDYSSCDMRAAVNVENGIVELKTPGIRYFVCGTPLHCHLGMRLQVETVAEDTMQNLSTLRFILKEEKKDTKNKKTKANAKNKKKDNSATNTASSVAGMSIVSASVILACLIEKFVDIVWT
ncbi:hypothetical protein ACHQM5_008018 [Ranunculus cassubicifolius]